MYPRRTVQGSAGAILTSSPLARFGLILVPSARNRTGLPVRRKYSASSPNRRLSRRGSFSELFTEQNLHGCKIRYKRKFEARHARRNFAEKFQHELHRVRRVVWHETARKQFRRSRRTAQRAQ